MYQQLYDLINTYIFEGAIVSGSYVDLVCTIAATIGNLCLVAVPFLVVFSVVKLIFRGW